MSLSAYVYALQADALAVQAKVDSLAGYPKPGIDVGGGLHVAPAKSVSTHAANVLSNLGGTAWALISCSEVDANVAAASLATAVALTAKVALDTTWYPVAPK